MAGIDWFAGEKVRASDLNYISPNTTDMDDDLQAVDATTTSTSYTGSLSGGLGASAVFVAQGSGSILLGNWGVSKNSGSGRDWLSFEIRAGAVVGSGTVIVAANDNNAGTKLGTVDGLIGRSYWIPGFTPGSTYNVRQMFKVSSGTTVTYGKRTLWAVPL